MKDLIANAVTILGKSDSDALYASLGAYSRMFPGAPQDFATPASDVAIPDEVMGPLDDAILLGKRILHRWQKAIYDLVCGTEDADPQVRKTILNALKLDSSDALAAAVATVLISFFSVAPAVAAVVGVLFGKVLLPAAGEEVCSFWKERMV
ncbi:hypothetical protein [Mesorhizobium silamurunense]|uniref:hypothetical protein n=1 Tax=Mesorhizobium silamurunense TaxID=499528 RepID=UPI0017870D2B|nr:hypothetical protein [Mesorhizobium silamurunense]